MDDALLAYYNAELAYLRELGAEFAENYPKVAARLQLEAGRCEDPHIERLLEGCAFLAARVRKKLDDDFPEIAQALLEILSPHALRPVPSSSIVQMRPGPDAAKLVEGYTVPAGTPLETPPIGGSPCRFRTVYPTTLWPLEVADARLFPDRVAVPGRPPGAVALLQISLRVTAEFDAGALPIDAIRFFLDGDTPIVHALYELIFNQTLRVEVRSARPDGSAESVTLPLDAIQPVGFGPEEGLVPCPARSSIGSRLLLEYFAFPEKFLFFDLSGLERLRGRTWGRSFDILFFLDAPPRSELPVGPQNFRLGCTPIVNLFSKTAEPIALDQTRPEYRVVPDVHRPMAIEVFSIDEVSTAGSFLDEPTVYEPFYAIRHARTGRARGCYWHASRRPSTRASDPGTEVDLAFVDPDFNPNRPAAEIVTVRTTCTNRDLPARLPFGGEGTDLTLAAPGPVSRVRVLRRPTTPLRPRLGKGALWRLISTLSLNHLSLVDSERGLDALRMILRLHDYADSAVTRQQVEGLVGISSRRVAGRVRRSGVDAVCQGLEVSVILDESHFVGSGAFLMAAVLERFLGLYASINSFTQLAARSRQREGLLKRWPPRTGDRTLL